MTLRSAERKNANVARIRTANGLEKCWTRTGAARHQSFVIKNNDFGRMSEWIINCIWSWTWARKGWMVAFECNPKKHFSQQKKGKAGRQQLVITLDHRKLFDGCRKVAESSRKISEANNDVELLSLHSDRERALHKLPINVPPGSLSLPLYRLPRFRNLNPARIWPRLLWHRRLSRISLACIVPKNIKFLWKFPSRWKWLEKFKLCYC